MSIEKYLKNTPDKTLTNTAWASTDGENLKLYKLSNAGENIGLEWCYSTNFNNTNFIDNSYIRTGIDSVDTAKTGVTCSEILPLANGRYVGKFDDSNVAWDKIKGLSFGIIYFEGGEMSFDNAYICSNIDYSRLVINTSAWDATNGNGERRYLVDSSDKVITNGYRAKLRSITTDGIIADLSGFCLAYTSTGDDGLPVIQLYNDNVGYETQVGSRWYQTNFVNGYKDSVHEYPYYTNVNYTFHSLLLIKHNNKYRKIFTIPHSKQAILHEQTVYSSQYGSQYGTSYFSCVDVQSWTRFMNATGLRYYDGTAFTDINDIKANMYMGVMDNDGITDCDNRIKGWDKIEASDLPNKDRNGYDWDVYDPTNPPAPDPTGDDYPNLSLDVIGATGLATGVSWFVMNETDMATLSKLGVYHSDPTVIETPWETINKANAVSKASEDAIISILQFPYDVSRMHSAEGRHGTIRVYVPGVFNSDSEWFGASECYTGAQGGYITDLNRIINAGSVTVPTRQGKATFLDFEPYTSLQMYVPFAGWVSLPCSQCMDATVALQYVIDPPTGSGRAFISANGCIIKDIPFTIGNITPTSVHQTGPLMGPLMNTAFGVAGTIAGVAMAAETGGLTATAGASMAVGAVSNLSNTLMDSCVPKTQTIGTNGTAITSFPTPKTPTILINRPRIKIPDNMGHRYGYACDKEAVLSDLSGMTVCSNVDTSGINATAGEKARLKAILESGFYA